ncbi:MAG: hypothetical protein AB1782_00430 [Cyanobacteriota bacterium]
MKRNHFFYYFYVKELDNSKILNSKIWVIILTVLLFYSFIVYGYRLPVDFGTYVDEGDFGRDLYYFYLVSKGNLPYVNFNWIYGPLTPLLYGLTFKIFGVSAFIALTLWYLQYIVCVYLIYYIIKDFSNHLFAFLGAMLFIIYYEGFLLLVFNHITGLLFILLCWFILNKYLDSGNNKYLYLFSVSCFLITITKLNMGLAFTFPIFLILAGYNLLNKKDFKHVIKAGLLYLLLCLFVYMPLILYSPVDQLHKSFPYSSKYLTMIPHTFIQSLLYADNEFISIFNSHINGALLILFSIYTSNIWYFIVALSGIAMSIVIYKTKGKENTDYLYIIILSTTIISCSNEFFLIKSFYSLRLWCLCSAIILIFYILNYILIILKDNKYLKPLMIIVTAIFAVGFMAKSYLFFFPNSLNSVYCSQERLKISTTRLPWHIAMSKTIQYILDHTKQTDKLLAIPYCSLYNFVSKREAPSRYTEFLLISGVTEEDEKKVIKDIEKNRVNTILYINKVGPSYTGFGYFGESHCKILDRYIKDNYRIDNSYYSDYLNGIKIPVIFYLRKTPYNDK